MNTGTVPDYITGLAGGIGGAVGAIFTNPLEVVKTRLQSSDKKVIKSVGGVRRDFVLKNLLQIIQKEGYRAFFKGLPITLGGVVPARAIYFFSYNSAKSAIDSNQPYAHALSVIAAGSSQILLTSPLWVVRTKQHLHRFENPTSHYTALHCIKDIYKNSGMTGFWRGASASMWGMSETMLFFILYEQCKLRFINKTEPKDRSNSHLTSLDWSKMGVLFTCACVCKATASISFYPHEVVRTRLREEKTKNLYRGFFQTLAQVRKDEGLAGWYSGLRVHLFRQIPNTAIMLCVVETTIFMYKKMYYSNSTSPGS